MNQSNEEKDEDIKCQLEQNGVEQIGRVVSIGSIHETLGKSGNTVATSMIKWLKRSEVSEMPERLRSRESMKVIKR